MKKIKGGDNNTKYIFLWIILLCAIIIISLYVYNNKIIDTFVCDETSDEPKIQKGISGISQSGLITFPKTFQNVPLVFTQMIGNPSDPNISYNVNIFNISQTGFNYNKNKVLNEKTGKFTITSMSPSNTDIFQWMAIA